MIDYSPEAIEARIREVERLTDFRPEHRLSYKVDYSPAAVEARIREVVALNEACDALGAATS